MFVAQLKVKNKESGEHEWRSIGPAFGPPYKFESPLTAWHMIEGCYPDCVRENFRVIKKEEEVK